MTTKPPCAVCSSSRADHVSNSPMCRFTRFFYLSSISEMCIVAKEEYEAKWTKLSEELKLTEEERVFLMSRLRGVHAPSVPLIFADLPLDAGLSTGLAMLGVDLYEIIDGGCMLKDAPRTNDAISPSPATSGADDTASRWVEEVD